MLSSIDGNTRFDMVLPEMSEMWRGDMCEDMEEAIREQLEASKVISDAVRDACFQPWSDPFVRTTAYEIPLEKYPSELGMALSCFTPLQSQDESRVGILVIFWREREAS